jgi:hypothetical protein
MAKLTKSARSKIPSSEFAGPGRSFPIENASHARAAITGATRSLNAGNISASTADAIKAKARDKLKGKSATKAPAKRKSRSTSNMESYIRDADKRLR